MDSTGGSSSAYIGAYGSCEGTGYNYSTTPKNVVNTRYYSPYQSSSQRPPHRQRFPQQFPIQDNRMNSSNRSTHQFQPDEMYSPERMTQEELMFYDTIDCTKSLLENIRKTLKKVNDSFEFDMGMLGVVIHKYSDLNQMNRAAYETAALSLSSYSLFVQWNSSDFKLVSPKVMELANNFYHNINAHKSKFSKTTIIKSSSSDDLHFKPMFRHTSKLFEGVAPFQKRVIVSTRSLKNVSNVTSRALSTIIKDVLLKISMGERTLQNYSLRSIHGKCQKGNYDDLPIEVVEFIEEFCLSCYDYPSQIRFPGYSYEALSTDNIQLASKLGSTEQERIKNFPLLVSDADEMCSRIFDKIQRTLNDVRNLKVERKEFVKNNEVIVISTFVPDELKNITKRGANSMRDSETPESEVGGEARDSEAGGDAISGEGVSAIDEDTGLV